MRTLLHTPWRPPRETCAFTNGSGRGRYRAMAARGFFGAAVTFLPEEPGVPNRSPARSAAARRRAAVAVAAVAPRRALAEILEKRVLLSGAGPLVISEFLADNSRV